MLFSKSFLLDNIEEEKSHQHVLSGGNDHQVVHEEDGEYSSDRPPDTESIEKRAMSDDDSESSFEEKRYAMQAQMNRGAF